MDRARRRAVGAPCGPVRRDGRAIDQARRHSALSFSTRVAQSPVTASSFSRLVAPVTAEDQLERNGTLSNGTGFPAVTFPGGFSAPTTSAPLGVPVGAELLGLDHSEAELLGYAFAFEQASGLRKPPKSTPSLPNEP